jgi:hypothetical protein
MRDGGACVGRRPGGSPTASVDCRFVDLADLAPTEAVEHGTAGRGVGERTEERGDAIVVGSAGRSPVRSRPNGKVPSHPASDAPHTRLPVSLGIGASLDGRGQSSGWLTRRAHVPGRDDWRAPN